MGYAVEVQACCAGLFLARFLDASNTAPKRIAQFQGRSRISDVLH